MKDIFDIFTTIITNTVLIGSVAWFCREIVKLFLSKDIEKYKSNLKKENESYKIRFQSLHLERAQIIKEIYIKMVSAHEDIHSLNRPMRWAGEDPEETKEKRAIYSTNELLGYYDKHKIFFEKTIADDMDSFMNEIRNVWKIRNHWRSIKPEESGSGEKRADLYKKLWTLVDKRVPELKMQLENKFRDIIGISEKRE